ncbi:uncharacterized protein CLUP02_09673 [Colletotrichum lupini]|uniref:Uncharacterized protein n=1 Tax=Colletotrichum lupini TaxID=145971 RepID=A0A9Q8SV83_9PEZI|nr:uncharacterized protein CLUP02_09673 [Colletotrichum lupini]UQC84177.1 hypothetical protein CLUP02_09673 [Colletotrichum lupini]
MGSHKPATVMLKRCLNSHLTYPCDYDLGRRHDEFGILEDNRRSFAQYLNCVGLGAAPLEGKTAWDSPNVGHESNSPQPRISAPDAGGERPDMQEPRRKVPSSLRQQGTGRCRRRLYPTLSSRHPQHSSPDPAADDDVVSAAAASNGAAEL